MDCHIEIFYENQWRDAARVSFSDTVRDGFRGQDCVFEYELDYAFDDSPPVSLRFPVNATRQRRRSWPAFMYDLVPQGNGRRFLLNQLGLSDVQASDLPLLCAGAFNSIGRLRIREAVDYFERHVERHPHATAEGFELDDLLARAPDFHETMMVHGMLAAGGTGVQGVAPKYLLTCAGDGKWHPDAALPDDRARAHYIVKRPRGTSAADRKVLQNEARYMAVARAMGIRSFDAPQLHGDLLFVPRFDRRVEAGRVMRFHQESVASIAELPGFGQQADQFKLLAALRQVVDDPVGETIEFLCRDVLNLALRNPDNHARNTAVHTADGVTRLTPLFDFAPMYLDQEGITRAARWYHPVSRKELHDWADVLPHLALPGPELEQVVEALVGFGDRMATLRDLLRAAQVDADIVAFVVPHIDAQRTQLTALRSA